MVAKSQWCVFIWMVLQPCILLYQVNIRCLFCWHYDNFILIMSVYCYGYSRQETKQSVHTLEKYLWFCLMHEHTAKPILWWWWHGHAHAVLCCKVQCSVCSWIQDHMTWCCHHICNKKWQKDYLCVLCYKW